MFLLENAEKVKRLFSRTHIQTFLNQDKAKLLEILSIFMKN